MPFFTSNKALLGLRQTPLILTALIGNLTQAQARKAIDGDDGWSVVEIVCHLRDMESIYAARAQRMVEADYPHLPTIDQVELVVKKRLRTSRYAKNIERFYKEAAAVYRLVRDVDRRPMEAARRSRGIGRVFGDGACDQQRAARCQSYRADFEGTGKLTHLHSVYFKQN